ncbi:hypothetical protein B0H10DRAFT_2242683 [Mycena sp. CBHHK59/15]|nr:hypothetical protein B0H10DRAFT_2242683 [Mycena sp. CBHHK59/15]
MVPSHNYLDNGANPVAYLHAGMVGDSARGPCTRPSTAFPIPIPVLDFTTKSRRRQVPTVQSLTLPAVLPTVGCYPHFPGKLFLIYFTSFFLFHLAPGVLRRYPHPYTFALANACAWAVLEAEVGPAPPAASPSPASGISEAHAWTGTLLNLLLCSASAFVWLLLFVHHGIVSRQNSVLKNIGAVALWILHGWEVVFFYGLFTALVAYVQKKRRSAAREAEPTEVPFEGWVLEEQDTPAPPEKAYTGEKP